jgi:NTP pyrophosphatase (non-canonical NTP hydrolase)
MSDSLTLAELAQIAESMELSIRAAGFDTRDAWIRQTLNVAEEAGEFVGSVRRFMGLARRSGAREEMEAEFADVIISSFAAAYVLGIDADEAIQKKLKIIFSRGWRQNAT